ncbi:MAG: RsmB/NOP family class I SAM-dependent RNA methyltransferase [Asticcacaulis sp.]
MSTDIGLPARIAALGLVEAALARRGGFDEAASHPTFLRLSDSERAFARALALLVLRRYGQISAILEKRLSKRPSAQVVGLLRIGLAQILGMDVPDFAAVSTTVKMAEREVATRPFKGLINAVLRGVIRDGVPPVNPRRLAPDWLWQRWSTTYGPEDAAALCDIILSEPPTDLSLNPGADAAALAEALDGEILPGGSLRSRLRGDLARWPHFEDGTWWVQDAAAAIPARLFETGPDKTYLDACSAPGGKTMQLATLGGRVTALDRSANRIKRVRDNLARTGLEAEVIVADAENWDDPRTFDGVLLDAPCSATGTFRRQPDVLWGAKPSEIGKLADVQHRLLDALAARVKPGGQLVYCVCSLEREEGETQMLAFLRRHPDFSTEPVVAEACGAPQASVTPEGWLRLLPHHRTGGQDGFFVARLRRQS